MWDLRFLFCVVNLIVISLKCDILCNTGVMTANRNEHHSGVFVTNALVGSTFVVVVKCKAMQTKVAKQKGTEQQSEAIYWCSHYCQHDETVFFSSDIWHVLAHGALLTNNQAAVLTAQHVTLEPFRKTAGVHSPLLSVFPGFQLPR